MTNEKMKVVYIAHKLGNDYLNRFQNRAKATSWAVWAANLGYAPIADWILISSIWDEDRRNDGLAIDCRLIELCDELWLCGDTISPGMNIELTHALSLKKIVKDLTGCQKVPTCYILSTPCESCRDYVNNLPNWTDLPPA